MARKPRQGYKLLKWIFGKVMEIPEEWKKTTLSENCIGKAEYGVSVSAIEKNLKLPRYIRITDLNDNGTLRYSEWKSISEEDAQDYILYEGDILFARTGATVGKTYLHQESNETCAFAGYLIRFKPDNKNLDSKFLFYLTHSKFYWAWLLSIQTWGVQPNVNAKQYSIMPILLPLINEQQKIASILSNVDALIQNTQQVVDKAGRLKKGLMQELLARGIRHTKFKKVKGLFRKEIEIPEEWKITKLDNIGEIVSGGTPNSKNKEYWNGNILWAVPTDITKLQTTYINNTERKITEKGLKDSSAKLLPKGTILLTSRATIGECAITANPISTNQGFQNIICNNKFDNLFIFYLLCNNKNTLIRLSYGTTFLEISKTEIKKMLILVPKYLPEQQKIASILSGVDAINCIQFIIIIILCMRLTVTIKLQFGQVIET